MASRILSEYKQRISSLKLVPSGGGCFELTIDGDLVHSKLKTGEFPDEGRILSVVDKRLR